MSTNPLPSSSVLVTGGDVSIVAHCVRREIERCVSAGEPVPATFHRILRGFIDASVSAELPPEAGAVPALVEVRAVPSGWVCTSRAKAPVSSRTVREAARRGRVPGVKVKGRIYVDPKAVEAEWPDR